jgi:hypothetical protein
MPQPQSLFDAQTSPPPAGPAYVCVNLRCRFQALEQLHKCPECGRVGNFILESSVQSRNLAAGIIFGVVGVVLILIALLILVASAAGYFSPQTEEKPIWKPLLLLFGLGAIFVGGGISTAKGSYWLVKLLQGVGRSR